MGSWNVPLQTVVYKSFHDLRTSVSSYCIFCLLMLLISGFVVRYLHTKVYQKTSTKRFPPTFPWMTYLRAMITNRKRADIFFPQFIFGVCSLYSKEGMYCIGTGPAKFLFIYNLEAVECLLSSRTILHKDKGYDVFKTFLLDGLFISNGSKWQTRKKLLMPSFHLRVLDDFFVSFNKQASIVVEKIEELMKKETSVEILDIIGLCTLDIVLETIAGVKVNEIETQRKEFHEAFHRVANIISKKISLPWLWSDFIYYRTKQGQIAHKCRDISHKFAREIIEKRKREVTRRMDVDKSNCVIQSNCETRQRLPMLDLLMNLHLKDNSFSFEDMTEELLIFIVAAHDTTAIAVSWTLYLLGMHEDIQRNVQQEVDEVLGDDLNKIITAEEVKSLKLLHCVLKESMRLYPPGGVVARTLQQNAIINGCEIQKGTTVVVPITVVHRNPEVFPNPEKFIPDRFNEQNSRNIHPFAYIPFSAGPRNCIGQRFATYSSMTILATLLRHFNVKSMKHRDEIRIAFNLAMEPENGIHLKFTRRQFLRNYSL